MSRLVEGYEGRRVAVRSDGEGIPLSVETAAVQRVLDFWREWVGVLEGEPEVSVWRVETAQGVCELHHLQPDSREGVWLLMRWED